MKLRIALAQINSTVGDLKRNADKIIDIAHQAAKQKADIVAFPELAICGYPAEDLLLKPQFLDANAYEVKRIAEETGDICLVVGIPEASDDVYNSAAVCFGGKPLALYRKIHLPNYAVFDEMRYFVAGNEPMVLDLDGRRIGLSICEDIWLPGSPENDEVLLADAQCILNISASPFFAGKAISRGEMIATRANDLNTYVCFVNLVGGQDELIFDGNSLIADYEGNVIAHARSFEEDLLICDIDLLAAEQSRLLDSRFKIERERVKLQENNVRVFNITCAQKEREGLPKITKRIEKEKSGVEEIYHALKLGCRDYIHKNGLQKVIIGLSGGVDSAITAVLAADALGNENVITLYMPSRYSSNESREDAFALAKNLGITCTEVHIDTVYCAYIQTLEPMFEGTEENVAEENIQARIRGNYLMAVANKFGFMVLTTGNKSENSVGYATLYGDMAGGFNIIKDVPKELVYKLCEFRNATDEKAVIPERILTKEPSAELRPNQKDTDSLPPYPVLDPILKLYVEKDFSFDQIVAEGFEPTVVSKVIRLVDQSEYKRRQASPGIRITPRAFGKDRRLPITNRYRDGSE